MELLQKEATIRANTQAKVESQTTPALESLNQTGEPEVSPMGETLWCVLCLGLRQILQLVQMTISDVSKPS